jgi:hypothetical protein
VTTARDVTQPAARSPTIRGEPPLPYIGQLVEVIDLAARRPAEVTRIEGRTLWVRVAGDDDDAEERPFDLHPTTANFVARGQPYWGTRLRV